MKKEENSPLILANRQSSIASETNNCSGVNVFSSQKSTYVFDNQAFTSPTLPTKWLIIKQLA